MPYHLSMRTFIVASILFISFYSSFPLKFTIRHRAIRRIERDTAKLYSGYLDIGKVYTASAENPPFFPINISELAQDASFSVKVAMISGITRIRIDIRLRLTNRKQVILEWLILLGERTANWTIC